MFNNKLIETLNLTKLNKSSNERYDDIVLRDSGTSFSLLHCSYKLHKQSFVNS